MTEKKEAPKVESKEKLEHVGKISTPQTSPEEQMKNILQTEYEALLQKVKDHEALQDRLLRSAADFENAKKRLAKEKEEFSQFVLENFLYELLPVLDNFERALSHRGEARATSEKSIWNGVELIRKQLGEILKLHGLVRMEVLKKPFDPHIHEAVVQVESQTEKEGTISEEVLSGYYLHGKVLRPAKVKVYSKEKQAGAEKAEEIT